MQLCAYTTLWLMSKKCIDCKNGIVKNTVYYKKALLIKWKKYKKSKWSYDKIGKEDFPLLYGSY